ncbi:hypothetical protein B0189_09180 [Moraxella cuniculi]|nr:hypothetical protein B0189_09180 [Moraxella cuniculi]
MNELTDFDKSYDNESYISKGKFSHRSLTRSFLEDKSDKVKKNINKKKSHLLKLQRGIYTVKRKL